MRTAGFLAPLFFAASSLAQAVEEGIEPSSSAPAGCERNVKGNFTIGVENFFAAKSKRETAQQAADGLLLCTLEDGVLRDQYSRTGSVVANRQFQFDGPPQAGAIYTGGFSICKNNSLAIGGSTRWWRCMSGAFGNLYDESIGDQCTEIRIIVDLLDDPSPSSSLAMPASSTVSLISTGGPIATQSVSATASSSGASSAASNSSASSAASGSASSQAATLSGSVTRTASGSASETGSGSSSPTASGAAPPAAEGSTPPSLSHAHGAVIAVLLSGLCAALHL